MQRRTLLMAASLWAISPVYAEEALLTALNAPHRSEKNKARDRYRHPAETLAFFGLKPDMKVVELWPGGGWYTEILAPVLADKGQLYVTGFKPEGQMARAAQALAKKLASDPKVYGKVKVIEIAPPDQLSLGADNSMDMVLTFRNIHNWMGGGFADQVYSAAYKALKPGGVFGVEEHRAKPGTTAEIARSGYVPEDYVISQVKKAGFVLAGKSEINSNPKDTRDYPDGVWTLPPTLTKGEQDKEKYQAIGESDRMTLKFVKK